VLVHEVIHGSGTILRPDGTFGFAYFEFDPRFGRFHERAEREVERVRASTALEPVAERDDLIHYSVIPWVAFTSFAHARHLAAGDSVPKIVFGKVYPDGGGERMPVSVEVHHALADGLDAGRFFETLAARFAAPDGL
jgi:chloramphenicol O-acetyltransferase type A